VAGVYVSLVMRGLHGVEAPAKLVAVALAEVAHQKDNGVSYPSVETLAHMCDIGERQVQRHLRELTASNWIMPEGATHGGRGMSTRYRLNLAKLRASVQKGDTHDTHSDAAKGDVDDTVKAKLSTEKGCHTRQERVTSTTQKGDIYDTRKGSEKDMKRFSRPREPRSGTVQTMSELLKPFKKPEPEKENGEMRTSTVQTQQHPDRPQMTQQEQIEWLNAQMRNAKP